MNSLVYNYDATNIQRTHFKNGLSRVYKVNIRIVNSCKQWSLIMLCLRSIKKYSVLSKEHYIKTKLQINM